MWRRSADSVASEPSSPLISELVKRREKENVRQVTHLICYTDFLSLTRKKESFFPPIISRSSPRLADDVRVIRLISCWDAGIKCVRVSSLPDSLLCSFLVGVSVWLSGANGTRQAGCVLGTFRSPALTHSNGKPKGDAAPHTCVIFAGGKANVGDQVYTKLKRC